MPPEIGRCLTKIGTHPHKQKKFQNMAVGPSRCCREVLLHVHRLQSRWRWTTPRETYKNDTALKGKKGTLNGASRYDSLTKNYYATIRTTPTTSHKPPCSTRPPLFTQPVKFNNTDHLASHELMLRQLHRTSRCTISISTTTNNNIPWDSDTLAFIDSFHPSQ